MENLDPQSGPPMAVGLPAMAAPQPLQPPEDDEPGLDPDKTLEKLEKWGKALDRHWADWLADRFPRRAVSMTTARCASLPAQ